MAVSVGPYLIYSLYECTSKTDNTERLSAEDLKQNDARARLDHTNLSLSSSSISRRQIFPEHNDQTHRRVFFRLRPAGLALLATAGPATALSPFFISLFAALNRSGFAPLSLVVVRSWFFRETGVILQSSPAYVSGAVPFLLGWWSPASVPQGCVRAVSKVVLCGVKWPNSDEVSVEPMDDSLKFGPLHVGLRFLYLQYSRWRWNPVVVVVVPVDPVVVFRFVQRRLL
ncbi:hypothetical protein Rs2_17270 [Raphanus sativus]|nr:hypothetical protein Rs2_17270 [Raphanus sativus]